MTAFGLKERRLGLDRRVFSYTIHVPERRCGEDRRCFSAIYKDAHMPELSPDLVAQLIADSCRSDKDAAPMPIVAVAVPE